jgi:hypothetical protein
MHDKGCNLDEGKEMLAQTRAGICRGHIGARALTAKVFKQGFYWPSIIDDASKLVTTCQSCQKSHHTFIAAAEMGHRHCRTIDNSTRKLQVYSSGS